MKIHIVQRNDTFQSIAEKYNVSVQDLIGMNTHINHLTGLVPGLKVKVPSPVRKEESNVAQHIQKYYPNLDTNPIELKPTNAPAAEPVVIPTVQETKVEVEQPVQEVAKKEEVKPIPLKPLNEEEPTGPNDGVKVEVGGVAKTVEEYQVSVNETTYEKPVKPNDTAPKVAQQQAPTPSTPYPFPAAPSMYPPYPPGCMGGAMPTPYMPPCPAPYPGGYATPYAVRGAQDERFFVGGFGYPFVGGWGWGGYPYYGGWGWGGYPYYGGWYRYPYLNY